MPERRITIFNQYWDDVYLLLNEHGILAMSVIRNDDRIHDLESERRWSRLNY